MCIREYLCVFVCVYIKISYFSSFSATKPPTTSQHLTDPFLISVLKDSHLFKSGLVLSLNVLLYVEFQETTFSLLNYVLGAEKLVI